MKVLHTILCSMSPQEPEGERLLRMHATTFATAAERDVEMQMLRLQNLPFRARATETTTSGSFVSSLLRTMFEGMCICDRRQHASDPANCRIEDAMTEACGGDATQGELLALFNHWSNDVLLIAAHYGVGLARKQPDGSLLHDDGTVDTLLKGGELTIIDVPAPPSPEHYWHGGQWKAPEQKFDQTQEA